MADNDGNILSENPDNIFSMDAGDLSPEKRNIMHRDKGQKNETRSFFIGRDGILKNRYQISPSSYEVDFTKGTAGNMAGFVGESSTLNRNTDEYQFDGTNIVALIDDEVRIHSTNGAGFEPAVANLLPFKDWITGGNWAFSGDNLQYSGTTYYSMFARGGVATATLTLDSDSVRSAATANSVKLAVSSSGDSLDDVTFLSNAANMPLYITNGTEYTLSFWAKGSESLTGVQVLFEDSGGVPRGLTDTFNLATSWAKYKFTFIANATDNDGRFNLRMGGLDSGGSFDVYIDIPMFQESSFASSRWIGGDAAVGSDVVVNGDFSATSEGTEMSSGTFTIGKTYKITAHDDADFTTVGSPDNNVGTYFTATAEGVGILDAGDKVVPITLDTWDDSADGLAPGASGGVLTNKASWDGSQTGDSSLTQTGILTSGKVYRISQTITRSAGTITPDAEGTDGEARSASGTYYDYIIGTGTSLQFTADSDFVGTVDDVSVVEHGSVGVTESAQLSYTLPTSPTGGELFAETLGSEIATGTCTLGLLYKITATEVDHFYTGCAVDEYFVSDGTETLDANNKVKQVTNAYNSGTGLLPPHGTVMAWVRFGFDEITTSSGNYYGIVSTSNAALSLLSLRGSNDRV
jgi:hypothetical protein